MTFLGASWRRAFRAPIFLASGLFLTGCWEQPVDERLHLTFHSDESLEMEVSVELHHGAGRTSAVEERLRDLEDALVKGQDPWKPRFDRIDPLEEDFYWRKEEGRLQFLARKARLEDAVSLAEFLRDTPIQAVYSRDEEAAVAEVAFYPGLPLGATRRERRQLEEAMEAWTQALEAYFASGGALYRYLETQPHRAEACFAYLFEDEALAEAEGPPTAEEEALLDQLAGAMGQVLEVLEVDGETAYSLDELSRRVYDPFPARLSVSPPDRPTEVEGFRAAGGDFSVPGLSLWSALEGLEGRWLAPDPLLVHLDHLRAQTDLPFDAAVFSARPRRAENPPSAEGIQEEVEALLRPADVYRLRWPIATSGGKASPDSPS